MNEMVLSILVENSSGVLNRVAGLFSRRGYNIDSLTVGETADPKRSRMTIVVHGEDAVLDQIVKQIDKLIDVISIEVLAPDASVTRELILVQVKATPEQRQQIIAIADVFRAKIVDVASDSLMVELTGNQAKLNAFIGLLEGYDILELVRTGITGLPRGNAERKVLDNGILDD